MVLDVRRRSSGAVWAAGLAAGYVADALLADPSRGHPVALFGRAATALERRCYQDSRTRGVLFTTAFGFAPASRSFLMRGSGSVVTIQGKFGAVSMLRRSTAQNNGVNRWASAWFTFT